MKVMISGDFCPNNRVLELVSELDASKLFNEFTQLNLEVDYSIINLECPIQRRDLNIDKLEKVGPVLYSDIDALKVLKKANFRGVTLANNHIKDIGSQGVLSTIEQSIDIGIDVVGAGRNVNEACRVLFKTIKGVKIGFYNVAENEFSAATMTEAGANPHDIIQDYRNITHAKSQCDFLMVIYHGGNESYNLPSKRLRDLFRFYVEIGADSVICHHSHVYSGYEVFMEKPIFYGLGNFSFDWPGAHEKLWNKGYSVCLDFVIGESIKFDVIPYIQGSHDIAGVRLMNEAEKKDFFEDLSKLNTVIEDDIELERRFLEFCKKKEYSYIVNFEPYNNKYLKALYKRKLLPSFLDKKKILNLLRCEAHRDVLLKLLK